MRTNSVSFSNTRSSKTRAVSFKGTVQGAVALTKQINQTGKVLPHVRKNLEELDKIGGADYIARSTPRNYEFHLGKKGQQLKEHLFKNVTKYLNSHDITNVAKTEKEVEKLRQAIKKADAKK